MLSRTSICKRIILSDRKVVHNNKLKNCKKKVVRNDDLQKFEEKKLVTTTMYKHLEQ